MLWTFKVVMGIVVLLYEEKEFFPSIGDLFVIGFFLLLAVFLHEVKQVFTCIGFLFVKCLGDFFLLLAVLLYIPKKIFPCFGVLFGLHG